MASVFRVPKLGLTAEEVKISSWIKQPGDPVKAGETFVVVETDKASLDVEAPQDGFLSQRYAAEGAVVAVGAELAMFVSSREELGGEPLPPSRPRPQASRDTEVAPRDDHGGEPAGAAAAERHRASPAVRRRARELGLDLGGVAGTGRRGHIRMQDLEGVVTAGPAGDTLAGSGRLEAMSRIRRATAERMLASSREIPQFTLRRLVDVEAVLEMRALLLESFRRADAPISMTDFLLQAAAHALMAHPALRSQIVGPLHDGRVLVRDRADIGIAVAVAEGLLVPVLPGVEGMTLAETARTRREAVTAAQAGRLPTRFASQGCFTISNLGPFDVDEFHALVNPGEAAIVAVGTVREVPVVHGGQVSARRRMALTFTFDHRLVDGAEGARFAKDMVDKLEGRDWRWM